MFFENAKKVIEDVTGFQCPDAADLVRLPRRRKAHAIFLRDDGQTPNNPAFPLILYRTPVALPARFDPAAVFETLFAQHGWTGSWRDGIYDTLHFHSKTHEVLGIARGAVRVQVGGPKGRTLCLRTGDVLIQPAGTGHCRLSKSDDLLVVGAYPKSGTYDEIYPPVADPDQVRARIARVPAPPQDPVYGKHGPLTQAWTK